MAYLDLSEVTKSIITLLSQSFETSRAWTLPDAPGIFPDPPNRYTGPGLTFYLYHIQENAQYKNFPPSGDDKPPVRFTPMALTLFYQLSANSTDADEGMGAYLEQLMMSVAMKTLHDNPIINDVNAISGETNRFKIILQPIPYVDASQYWTAGSASIKLSAYYEVSVVFLEPEETQSYAGRVLTYGTYLFADGPPRITLSQNIISYTIPGGQPGKVKVQPAQVPYGDQVDFTGTGFTGDEIALLLSRFGWTSAARADAAWNVQRTAANQVTATVQTTAIAEDTSLPVDVLPGVYSARIEVKRKMTLPNGSVKVFTNTSNPFPFTIIPGISSISGPSPDVEVEVVGFAFDTTGPDFTDNIIAYIGDVQLKRVEDPAALGEGEFAAISATRIRAKLPDEIVPLHGQSLPLRILVDGIESPPRWIQIP